MKRRLLLVYICIILCMALTGCEKNGTQEKVVNSQELVSYDISTESADDEEVLTAEESVSYE